MDNPPTSFVTTDQTLHQTDKVIEKQRKKMHVHTTEQKLYSLQPRFSTS
jgi:hypothetical protein